MLRGLFGRLQMEEEVQFVLPFQQFLEWELRYLLTKSKTGTDLEVLFLSKGNKRASV